MFEIEHSGEVLRLAGRLDAAAAEKNPELFAQVTDSTVIDFAGLDYISSAGLGLLFAAQKGLLAEGGTGLTLINLKPHIRDVFEIAGFDKVFVIAKPHDQEERQD